MFDAYKVRRYPWDGYSYCVEWFIEGRRRRKAFHSQREAKDWADLKNIELANSGLNALSVSESMRVEVQRCLLKLEPYGKTIEEAVSAALPLFEAERSSKTVRDAVDSLLELKTLEGRSHRYRLDMKSRLGMFSKTFGDRYIATIGTREIKEFLMTQKGSMISRNNMRRLISVLFSHSMENEWCDGNPAQRIRAFAEPRSAIGILTPAEASALLNAACDELKPLIAIGLFAGLRRSELLRVSTASIYPDSGVLRVDVTKTGASRRFVKIRPNLKSWLERYPVEPMKESTFRDLLSATRKAAKLTRWPHNALRHSFCSYALAEEKNLHELVLEMGHTNAHTLFQHYRELVSEQEALAYWSISAI